MLEFLTMCSATPPLFWGCRLQDIPSIPTHNHDNCSHACTFLVLAAWYRNTCRCSNQFCIFRFSLVGLSCVMESHVHYSFNTSLLCWLFCQCKRMSNTICCILHRRMKLMILYLKMHLRLVLQVPLLGWSEWLLWLQFCLSMLLAPLRYIKLIFSVTMMVSVLSANTAWTLSFIDLNWCLLAVMFGIIR